MFLFIKSRLYVFVLNVAVAVCRLYFVYSKRCFIKLKADNLFLQNVQRSCRTVDRDCIY
jgi:hypothetical protein